MSPPFKFKARMKLFPNYAVLSLLVLFAIVPLIILVFNSLKDPGRVGAQPARPT